MKDGDLEQILSRDPEIVPSSGFASSVMEAIQAETSAPSQIPFPWKRAIPGLTIALALLVVLIVAALGTPPQSDPSAQPMLPRLFSAVSQTVSNGVAGWVALAVLLSITSVALSLRFARRL